MKTNEFTRFHFFTPNGFEDDGIRTPGRQKPDGGAGEDPKGGRLFCHEGLGPLEIHPRERGEEKRSREAGAPWPKERREQFSGMPASRAYISLCQVEQSHRRQCLGEARMMPLPKCR